MAGKFTVEVDQSNGAVVVSSRSLSSVAPLVWRWKYRSLTLMGRSDRPRGMKRRRSSGSAFAVGAEVEVRSDEDGFRGAWYEATVVRQLSQRRFEVVYAFLVEDHDPSQPLREVVQRSHLRPQPPPLPAADASASGGGRYSLHDLVEAFHNDGWWAGVIFAVLHGPTTTRYLVSFPTSREEVVFEESQMRRQLQWVRGRWVSVDEQRAEEPAFSIGAQVEVSRDRENYGAAWFGASVMEVFNSSTILVEYENLKAENNDELLREIVDAQYIRSCQPNAAQAKDFVLNDEVEVLHHGGWVPGMISKILDGSKYIIKMLHDEKETEYHLPISVSTSSGDDDDVDVTYEPGSTKLSLKRKEVEGQLECLQVCNNMKNMDSLEYSLESPCSSLLVGYPATPMTEINLSVAMPMVEYSSSVEEHHSESPSLGEIAAVENVGTTLPPNPLLGEHRNEHENGVRKIPVRDEVSPHNSGNRSEHQSKVMPQQPHFRPLEQYSMEFREGMAIGLMISFANLVANIQQIHIDDAQATIEGRLRALGAFEANGFDVHCLRSRLQELLEMHVNRRQCETRKAALKVKMLEKKDENERLDSLIAAFDKAIMELEQNLASFRDKKDSVIREWSNNDSEISKLLVDILEAEVTYNSAEENFKAILSAPW
ncbi:hypothetical protein GW17_00033428 [Ensete ventricosum]|nr:hypothetical protein GW17_00033428 [Ensete ventricosum]